MDLILLTPYFPLSIMKMERGWGERSSDILFITFFAGDFLISPFRQIICHYIIPAINTFIWI